MLRARAHTGNHANALSRELWRLHIMGAFVAAAAAANDNHPTYWFYWLGLENGHGIL